MTVHPVRCKTAITIDHFIALGANLPAPDGAPPLLTCLRALHAIRELTYAVGLVRSRSYSTASYPDPTKPRYINLVARLTARVAPERLLADLQRIENEAGRVRTVPNAPRVLDLDIIDSAGTLRADPSLTLPHPRAHLRRFVLQPLRDVAPAWVHPQSGVPIASLLMALPAEDIHPI